MIDATSLANKNLINILENCGRLFGSKNAKSKTLISVFNQLVKNSKHNKTGIRQFNFKDHESFHILVELLKSSKSDEDIIFFAINYIFSAQSIRPCCDNKFLVKLMTEM